MALKVVGPSTPGIMTSMRMASGCSAAAMEIPSAPELAVRICQPAVASRERAATSRMSSSSSIIKTRRMSELILSCDASNGRCLAGFVGLICRLGGRACGGEVSKLGANAVDHGEDELFDLLGLDLGFGEELCGSEAELGHFGLGDLAAGVDDQRQSTQSGLLAKPFDEREAIAIGEGEVEDEEIRRPGDALANGLLARGGVVDVDCGILKAGGEDAGQVFVIFDEEDVGGTLSMVKDATELGEEEIFVEGLLDPALGVAGELGAQGGGENAQDNDGDVGGDGIVAEALEGFPT